MEWQVVLFIAGAVVVLLIIARLANQFLMHERMTDALTQRDNPGIGVALAGYLFGVIMIITDVLSGPGHADWVKDAMWVGIYGVGGILFLIFVSTIELRWILSKDALKSCREGNTAAGIAIAGSYIATSQVIAATVSGEGSGGTFVTAIVFFLVGQITLLLVTVLFRVLTSYKDTEEILKGNVAAALSYAGVMIAVSIIVSNSIRGDFTDYETSLKDFGFAMIGVVALYPIRQFLVQGILLGAGFKLYGGALDDEISRDKNVSAGVIEAMTYIAAAILATRLF